MKIGPGEAGEVTFEERRVEDLAFAYPREAFERVRDLSEANELIYTSPISPWVQTLANPWTASALAWLHPMRLSRYIFGESFSPWMRGVAALSASVAAHRQPLASDHPFIAAERFWFSQVTDVITAGRRLRDAWMERSFDLVYGSDGLPPSMPESAPAAPAHPPEAAALERRVS
jgi:hypothetical protein